MRKMMLKSSLCCFLCWGLAVIASQQPTESSTPHPQAATQEQPAIVNPNPKPTAPRSSTSIPITRAEGNPHGKRNPFDILKEIFFRGSKEYNNSKNKLSTSVNLMGASYIAHVTVGSQVLPLLVDTSSSDLWVAASDFQCLDQDGHEADLLRESRQGKDKEEQAKCTFPVTYMNSTPRGGLVSEEYFSIRYGNGQFLYGAYGIDSVSLGGITVPNQRIALPSRGYFQSSTGDFSGILGLAYPAMVAARKGETPKESPPPPSMVFEGDESMNDKLDEEKSSDRRDEEKEGKEVDEFGEYDTWFFNAVKHGLTKPFFSLALDVDGGGMLGIGEVVDVPVAGDFVSTPILKVNLVNEARAVDNYTFYTVMADDYILNGTPFSQLQLHTQIPQHEADGVHTTPLSPPTPPSFPVVVDSGWTTNVLPPSLVTAFYDTFPSSQKPQPVEIDGEMMFAASCGITPPSFGVQIGKEVVLEMHSESILVARLNTTADVVVDDDDDDGPRTMETVLCALGIQPGVEFAGVLGDTFLSSVVAVFDVGEGEMRFAQRPRGERVDEADEQGRDEL